MSGDLYQSVCVTCQCQMECLPDPFDLFYIPIWERGSRRFFFSKTKLERWLDKPPVCSIHSVKKSDVWRQLCEFVTACGFLSVSRAAGDVTAREEVGWQGGVAAFTQSQSVRNVKCCPLLESLWGCPLSFLNVEMTLRSGKAAAVAASTLVFLDSFACTCFYLVFFCLQQSLFCFSSS